MAEGRQRHRLQGEQLTRPVLGAGLAALALALGASASAEDLKVERVEVRASQMGAAVLLRVGKRAIAVFVDPIVAQSIESVLRDEKPARPLTHDLMRNVLKAYDGNVRQVVVTLQDNIFYAALSIELGGKTQVFDSRSSDAIALAVHFKAPIFVSRELLDRVGVELDR